MKRKLSVMFLICILVWSACNKNQKLDSNASVEIINGIEYIHNTETPMYPGKTVTFVEDLSISGEDKDGKIILFEPRLSLVDDKENIYISEMKDNVIKVFGSNGEYIRTIGSKGSGPGEFQRISYIAITKEGEVVVPDSGARRTSFFDSSDQFLKSFQWQTRYGPFILIKSSSYITGETGRSEDRKQWLYVKEIDFDGLEIQSFGEFTHIETLEFRQKNGALSMLPPVPLKSEFSGDQERSWFYHCLNNTYIIEVYDSTGKLFRKIDRPYEPVPFTNKDVEDYRQRFAKIPEIYKKNVEAINMPKYKSLVVKMYVDDESKLWIQTNEKKEEKDKILTAFDIFDPDGHYYAKVWTEFIPFIFKKGKMYRMAIDQETGYQTLKRYKVVWK